MNINEIMKELAEYIRIQEETAAIIDALKDQVKQYMKENNIDTVIGADHKAMYKPVTSSRIDTTALKKENPGIAAIYTKTAESMRFTFN